MIFLKKGRGFQIFVGKMFWIGDKNHCLQEWSSIIDKVHYEKENWHILLDSILLNPSSNIVVLFTTMYDLNR